MKLGFFSDAHGNEQGFTRCLEFLLANTDRQFFLGDAVGYFPLSNSILDRLRTGEITAIKGNHDAMLLGELPIDAEKDKAYGLRRSAEVITAANREYLEELAPKMEMKIDGRRLLFVHGGPFDPLSQYIYPDTDLSQFDDLKYDAVFTAHTHRPFVRKHNGTLFVNTGSCGFCREQGDELTVAVYVTETNEATITKFTQDVELLIAKYGEQLHPILIDALRRKRNS